MTDTIARYAAAFAKVNQRWPDAPTLPEGYRIDAFDEMHFGMGNKPLPPAAALALCTVWAARSGQSVDGNMFRIYPFVDGRWYWQTADHFGFESTIEEAYLAALEAIVGSST